MPSDPNLVSSRWTLGARVAGAVSAALGLLVIVGWYCRSVALIQVLPSFVPMQYNTALGFLLCGVGLTALAGGRTRATIVCGSIAGGIGLLTLIEYVAGPDLGIDQLLMEHYITVQSSHPGRMAPNTALSFLLVGTALVASVRWASSRRRYSIAGLLGCVVLALGAIAFVGYVTDAESAYGWGQLTRMAVHTALGFGVLGLGLISFALGGHKSLEAQRPLAPGAGEPRRRVAFDPARDRRRIVAASIAIMAVVSLTVGLTIAREHYSSSLEAERSRLVLFVQGQARMMAAVARFDARYSQEDVPGGARAATMGQIRDAFEGFQSFGETGELLLAVREGDEIVFLVGRHGSEIESLAPAPFLTDLAEPMLLSIAGETGSFLGLDHHGERVIAAHEWVEELDLGLVAKIDLAQIRAPVVRNMALAVGTALVIILIGAGLLAVRINPLLDRLQRNSSELIEAHGRLLAEVAERERAETELRELASSLEVRVAERTGELETARKEAERNAQQLAEANTDLERSNHDLQHFAYVASHDLQEPLRMVASFTQLLADRYRGQLDKDADDFIGYAVDGATRMQGLIQGLLEYSRVSSKGEAFGPVDCESLFARILVDLQPLIVESGTRVTHGPLPTVTADGGQLGRVLQNLVSNALKFRAAMSPSIYVGAEKLDGAWRFEVRDNGLGIDSEHAERVFEIFQRLHARSDYPGTGIGLAICRRIVERHRGRIWVESAGTDQGSTFYFTLPDRRVGS